MLETLVGVILPVVLVAGVGYLVGRRFTLDVDTLSKIGLYAFTPALAFDSMMTTQISAAVGTRIVLAYLVGTLVAGILTWGLTRGFPAGTRRSITACTIIGNNGNFGLPMAKLAFGDAGLQIAVVIFVLSLLIMFTVGPLLFGSSGGMVGGLRTVARLPVTWALAVAGLFRLTHITLPSGIGSGVELLGQAAIPVVLVQLGLQISRSGRIRRSPAVVTTVLLRILLVPATALAAGLAFGLDGLGLAGVILAAAMPIAVNNLMLASEYGADTDTVASSVVASTLLAIPVIALMVPALERLA